MSYTNQFVKQDIRHKSSWSVCFKKAKNRAWERRPNPAFTLTTLWDFAVGTESSVSKEKWQKSMDAASQNCTFHEMSVDTVLSDHNFVSEEINKQSSFKFILQCRTEEKKFRHQASGRRSGPLNEEMLKARNSFRPPRANFQRHSFFSMADTLCHVPKPSVHQYISVSDSWDNLLFLFSRTWEAMAAEWQGTEWQANQTALHFPKSSEG